jgi:hypothetical protein
MKILHFLAVAGLGVCSGNVGATTVTVQFDPAYSTPVTVDRTVDGGANWYLQDPGQFHFFTQPGSPSDIPAAFYSFCIEPREFLTPGQYVTYNEVPVAQGTTNIGGMGDAKAALVDEFLYRFYPDFSVKVDPTLGAALQVALWKIIRENQQGVGTWNLAAGDVQFRTWSDTAVRDLAASMLAQVTGNGPYITTVNALALIGTQDVLVDPPAQATPEASTLLLGATGLLLVGVGSRRSRKR